MKKLSIKLKITLWFTCFMVILAVAIFVFITFVSNSTTTHQIKALLTSLVNENTDEIDYDDGRLEIDDDFISYKDGIYCIVLNENGEKISGYSPYGDAEPEPLRDGSLRSVMVNGVNYLIYDKQVSLKAHEDIWVRGIVPESGNTLMSSAVYRAILIALPLLIVLAAVGGYLIAGKSLRPIQKISKTAEDIGDSGDLSKRIEMEANGDELHQLAGTFNHMFDRLEANFEAERNFTSDASHELRTPVSVILAQCEYAFENASGEQELYESIGAIQKQGYRMAHLIESLLYFTRIEQRTEPADFEIIDLSKAVISVCEEQRLHEEKNITLSADVRPDITIKADISLISRMLENLIRNAYRYGREDGNILVALKKSDKRIILSVKDDGIGIAKEELPKIWSRFYRVEKSRSMAKGAGLGLGLSMVSQIVKLHGGTIQVESEPGRGSVFTIFFGG